MQREAEAINDEVDVNLEDDIDVNVVDDTPVKDKKRKPLKEDITDPTDDELTSYSEDVQNRIKKAHHKFHDERRAKEQAEREREQALAFARTTLEKARTLEKQLSEGSKVYIETSQSEANLALEAAKKEYKEAFEAGDSDKLTEAQVKIANAANAMERVKNLKPLTEKDEEVYSPKEQPVQPVVDQRAAAWAAKNPWWGGSGEVETTMTGAVLAYNDSLLRKGYHPQSDEYYEAIDKFVGFMKGTFPQYFDTESDNTEAEEKIQPRAKTPTVVASVRRNAGPKKVTLTSSEVAVANKLGVSLKDYAKAKLEREMRND